MSQILPSTFAQVQLFSQNWLTWLYLTPGSRKFYKLRLPKSNFFHRKIMVSFCIWYYYHTRRDLKITIFKLIFVTVAEVDFGTQRIIRLRRAKNYWQGFWQQTRGKINCNKFNFIFHHSLSLARIQHSRYSHSHLYQTSEPLIHRIFSHNAATMLEFSRQILTAHRQSKGDNVGQQRSLSLNFADAGMKRAMFYFLKIFEQQDFFMEKFSRFFDFVA